MIAGMRVQVSWRRRLRFGRANAERKRDGRHGVLLRFDFLRIIVWDRDRAPRRAPASLEPFD
jgi:hypothetical protein